MNDIYEKAKRLFEEKAKVYGDTWQKLTVQEILVIIRAKVEKMFATIRYPPLFEQDLLDLINWVSILVSKSKNKSSISNK